MSEFPAPPPPPRSTNWKVIIPVIILVLLCCCLLAVAGVLAYLGTQGTGPLSMLASSTPTRTPSPTPTPTIAGAWDLYYDWDCTGTYNGPADIAFLQDGTFELTEDTISYGTWSLAGGGVEFTFDGSPYAHYTGTVDESLTYMEGTMDTSDGGSGCWYANLIP